MGRGEGRWFFFPNHQKQNKDWNSNQNRAFKMSVVSIQFLQSLFHSFSLSLSLAGFWTTELLEQFWYGTCCVLVPHVVPDLSVTVQVRCLLKSVAGVVEVLLELITEDTETGDVQLSTENITVWQCRVTYWATELYPPAKRTRSHQNDQALS